jgi:hypothetical protein
MVKFGNYFKKYSNARQIASIFFTQNCHLVVFYINEPCQPTKNWLLDTFAWVSPLDQPEVHGEIAGLPGMPAAS